MTTVTFDVPGAHCGSCRADIERSLANLPGLASSTVDLRAKTLVVTFDDRRLDESAIVEALRVAGYPTSGPTASPSAGQQPGWR